MTQPRGALPLRILNIIILLLLLLTYPRIFVSSHTHNPKNSPNTRTTRQRPWRPPNCIPASATNPSRSLTAPACRVTSTSSKSAQSRLASLSHDLRKRSHRRTPNATGIPTFAKPRRTNDTHTHITHPFRSRLAWLMNRLSKAWRKKPHVEVCNYTPNPILSRAATEIRCLAALSRATNSGAGNSSSPSANRS